MTTVHMLGADDGRCLLCAAQLPVCDRAEGGDYVGVTSYEGSPHMTGYRIGENNHDARCDGAPHTEFSQESL